MDFVEKVVTTGATVAERWKLTALHVWQKACEYDKVPPDSPVVVFSKKNPFVKFYERAVQNAQEAEAGINAIGYVGLVIVNGRAQFPDLKKKRKKKE